MAGYIVTIHMADCRLHLRCMSLATAAHTASTWQAAGFRVQVRACVDVEAAYERI